MFRSSTFSFVPKLFLCLVFWVSLHASESTKPLRVGIKEAPPFTIKDVDGNWSGLCVDLFKDFATERNFQFDWVELSLNEVLVQVADSKIDFGVAAITVTEEREKKFDFSFPFYSDGLAIAVRDQSSGGLWPIILRFISVDFLTAVAALLGLLLVFGFLIWLFERQKNSAEFAKNPVSGIGSGLWWSAVTMTTVGYGDKSPKSFFGRLLALIWMFASIIVISGFTASIASSLTVDRITYSVNNANDLYKVKTGAIAGTTGIQYLKEFRKEYLAFPNPKTALEALKDKRVEAVLYDRPILLHEINSDPAHFNDLFLLKDNINQESYAIAIPEKSEMREALNRFILKYINSPSWSSILEKYLGQDL